MGIPYMSKRVGLRPLIKKMITCPGCDGAKINPEKPTEKCPDCKGEGQIEITR